MNCLPRRDEKGVEQFETSCLPFNLFVVRKICLFFTTCFEIEYSDILSSIFFFLSTLLQLLSLILIPLFCPFKLEVTKRKYLLLS